MLLGVTNIKGILSKQWQQTEPGIYQVPPIALDVPSTMKPRLCKAFFLHWELTVGQHPTNEHNLPFAS